MAELELHLPVPTARVPRGAPIPSPGAPRERRAGVAGIGRALPERVVPNDEVGVEAFAVIREAMVGKGVAALGRVVMNKRERVIALEPFGKGLIGTTLHYSYEVRKAAALVRWPSWLSSVSLRRGCAPRSSPIARTSEHPKWRRDMAPARFTTTSAGRAWPTSTSCCAQPLPHTPW